MQSKRISRIVVFATALFALPALAQDEEATMPDCTPAIPSLSNDQVNRLNAGEILVEVTNARVPIGDMLAVIDAPAQSIAEVILDFNAWSEFIPNITESTIVNEAGEPVNPTGDPMSTERLTFYLQGVTDTPWPMDDRTWRMSAWYNAETIEGVPVWTSGWDYVPGSGNLEDSEGYWLLIPWGDDGSKTLVRYYLAADLGTWVPDFLLSWGTENMLPEMITGIRGRI